MCVIIDTNAVGEVFGEKKTVAGKALYKWIMEGGINPVVGKIILEELNNKSFKKWYSTAILRGWVKSISKQEDNKAIEIRKELIEQGQCKSNDQHIIALAQVSGARLLYTHDNNLMSDFKDIVRGKVYPRRATPSDEKGRKQIRQTKNWCVAKRL